MKGGISIVEKYVSIQGETTFAGRLAYFIRLAGCNLKCRYCDTEYSRKIGRSRKIGISGLAREISESGVRIAVITGGEPLLQKNAISFAEMLLKNGIEVILETNGSLPIGEVPEKVIKILDCKCPLSGEADKMDFSNFRLLRKHDQVKFVISGRKDYEYAVHITGKYGLFKKTPSILLSPASPRLRASTLAGWMIRDRFPAILNLQLHRIIWPGRVRGV